MTEPATDVRKFGPARRDLLKAAAASAATLALTPWVGGSLAHAQPAQGKTLTVAIPGVPVTLDPVNITSHDWMAASQAVFENLIEFDVNGNPQPQLAAAMPTVSDDKTVYTFDLRDDVHFHNGQKFTAEDVKYSFDYLLNPDNKAVRRPVFARIRKVTILGPTRVRFELSEPYGPWLAFMTKCMGIFPTGSRENNPTDFFRTGPVGVGTGPGIFEEWRPNEYIALRRNPDYWRKGLPAWDRLVIRQINEESVRVAYLLSGQVDLISAPPPRDFARLKSLANLDGASRPTLGGWFAINCDNKRPPLDDANFRKAISCAIDRKTIADKVYYGLLSPAAMPAPPGAWWYNADTDKAASFDLARAKDFLARSRYPEGATIDLAIPSEPYLLDVKDAALVLQSQLGKIGVKVNLKAMEFQVFINSVIRGEQQASLFVNMSPGEPTYHLQNSLTPSQLLARSINYDGPDLVALLKQGFAEDDREKAKKIYADLQAVLVRDMPMVWIGFVHAANLWRRSVVKELVVNQGLTFSCRDVQVV
jgi:peptide/nickel transport system substrate-binding protein